MATTPRLGLTLITSGRATAESRVNTAIAAFDVNVHATVKSRTTATPPGSPTEGDVYIVPGSGTSGAWVGAENLVAWWTNGAWVFLIPLEGWRFWVEDQNAIVIQDGTQWAERAVGRIATGIVASTTQTQVGGTALVAQLNIVATCANANDTVTLPPAYEGRACTVVNMGAQTCKVYPASGDSIDALAVDASTTITAGSRKRFEAVDGTKWYQVA